jgi:Zn-dependent membrane protease YugP
MISSMIMYGYGSYYGVGNYQSGLGLYVWEWILIIAAVAVTGIASLVMKNTVSKYSQIPSGSGITGGQAAQRILGGAGIPQVGVRPISGQLTDHYDPRDKTVGLAEESYGRGSVASIAIAAHECGHAVQDATNYAPLRIRSSIVPVANFGSMLSWPLIIIGLIFSWPMLAKIGIGLFCAVVIFQLVTLPVEFDASRRGLKMLRDYQIVSPEELAGSRKVLTAAAMTYVAALASSILQLVRILLIVRGNDRD